MEPFEKLFKTSLLSMFGLLNIIDMIQTVSFLQMGIEGNQFVVHYPYLWFPLKLSFAFGLPIGLYWLDLYLDEKEDEGIFAFLKLSVYLMYLMVLLADFFFLSLVLRNARILGRLLP